jgi:hypothetical protein
VAAITLSGVIGGEPNARREATRDCALDRLTFGGNIIGTGTDSYCLAHTKAAQGHIIADTVALGPVVLL